MPDLLTTERETYQAIWQVEAYARYSPGVEMLPIFLDMVGDDGGLVLDAGCGSGLGALALEQAGFRVRMCDLTPDGLTADARGGWFDTACLWRDLRQQLRYIEFGAFDWVYCCDVLEHIPTPFTMLVVRNLLDVARRGVFLSISLQPDQFGAWIGKPLHQSVQSFTQWRDQLSELGSVRECRDLLTQGVYLVEPRC